MRVFDDEPARSGPRTRDWEQHRATRHVHAGPPRDEVGVLAMGAVGLGRAHDVVVALRAVTACSDGLLLSVAVLFADEQSADLDWSLQEYHPSPGRFQIGVVFADGTRATSGNRDSPDVLGPATGAVLTLQHGWRHPLQWIGEYWLWPLPPPGGLVVACRWPDRGIAENSVMLDPAPLLAAAATSLPVWTTP
ncbi:MAG: hypothetical protein JWO60_2537 [Frankiales bacterium]|nr:hypothetical protein [Frankiales bacterium]